MVLFVGKERTSRYFFKKTTEVEQDFSVSSTCRTRIYTPAIALGGRDRCRAEAPRLNELTAEDLQFSEQGPEWFSLYIKYPHGDVTSLCR